MFDYPLCGAGAWSRQDLTRKQALDDAIGLDWIKYRGMHVDGLLAVDQA